jgi:hypothetical protein
MRRSITSVQLAILEIKQTEAAKAIARLDELHKAAQLLLEIGEFDGHADDHLADFLNGDCTAAELLERIGVSVGRPLGRIPSQEMLVDEMLRPGAAFDQMSVRIYGRDIEVKS